jgi:hypothetical protein
MGGTKNILGEFAERIVGNYYRACLLPPSNKSADLEIPNSTGKPTRIQVKSRKLDKIKSTSLNIIRSWNFDLLVIVLFDANGDILKAIELDKKTAKSLARPNAHQNGWILTTSSRVLNHPKAKDITTALQYIIDNCFPRKRNSHNRLPKEKAGI